MSSQSPQEPPKAPGSLSGTIRDKAGAAISGAKVSLTNVASGATRTIITDIRGRYELPILEPGTYNLRVEKAHFQMQLQSGIIVRSGVGSVINRDLPPAVQVEVAKYGPQQLLPNAITPNLLEGFEARIADPLWFLARQWQTGEFEGENGGALAQVEVTTTSVPLDQFKPGPGVEGPGQAFSVAQPLNSVVEGEIGTRPPAWDSSRLEYGFELGEKSGFALLASEYDGQTLDWYHFDVKAEGKPAFANEMATRMVPQNIRPAGVPHSRWWRFEDAEIDVTQLVSAEPNFLQMLLAEFLMVDADNWFVLPVELQPGYLHHLLRMRVVDSFGIYTDVPAALRRWGGDGWSTFTHSDSGASVSLDGSYLYLPNTVPALTQGEPLEDVYIVRDESANAVFAVEKYYTDDAGLRVNRGDVENAAVMDPMGLDSDAQADPEQAKLPVYRLMRPVPKHWIPYIPRRAPATGSDGTQMYLRRARTDETFSRDKLQYRTQIVGESWRLVEEEVPRTGLRVQRLRKMARDCTGKDYFWVGRRKDISATEHSAGADFDYLLDVKPTEPSKHSA